MFIWTDRRGAVHNLDTPEAIDDEAEQIAAEIDACLKRAREGSPDEVRQMRVRIRLLMARYAQIAEDAKRWNEFALNKARDEARRISIAISEFIEAVPPVVCPAALHEETVEELADPSTRAQLLSGPMTEWQQWAIEFSHLEPKPSLDATRGEALEWLNNDPMFSRPLSDEGGWFEWSDADGVTQRLASPLKIEAEIGRLAESLDAIETKLTDEFLLRASLEEVRSELERVNILFARLAILQCDLERFAQEQSEREEQEWARFENQWEYLKKPTK
ncbi:MAG: hypothetical protein C0496_01300 [Erythrobacter sp.]|nr:hypothetical protein [Erythrobacter sp.]PPC81684.1 MAG: hypothetical protein CTY39_10230 [Hyphomicrobium sp.]